MNEWQRLGDELQEANPGTYVRVVEILRTLVAAEKRLASPDIAIIFELLRARFVDPGKS